MRRLLTEGHLSWVAAFSLAIIVVLFCGYFLSLNFSRIAIRTGIPSRADFWSIQLSQGQFFAGTGSFAPAPAGFVPGCKWRVRPRAPDLQYSIWKFRLDSQQAGPGWSGRTISFPIWCLLLPCLIAPVLWLRQRGFQNQIGFAVITKST